jgi:lysophospholipase L1-like esterase
LGFVLAARPWAWYNRRGLEMSSSGWHPDIAGLSQVRDGLFGIGAVSFRGAPNSVAQWKLRDPSQSSVEIAYLMEVPGGEFDVEADGNVLGNVNTDGDAGTPGFARFDLPEGSKAIAVKVTRGAVRIYGADFRKAQRGVVYSSLGVNGANVTLLSHALDPQHWATQLRHYQPDLVIINYGTNESGFATFVDTSWGAELRTIIKRIRTAVPGTSILLMSPMDRGGKDESGAIATLPALPRLVAMEQKIAFEQGVGFFNTFEAMGGEGTMARWYASEPRLVGADYIHPMPAGARIVGDLLFSAFRQGFEQYKMQEIHTRTETATRTVKAVQGE